MYLSITLKDYQIKGNYIYIGKDNIHYFSEMESFDIITSDGYRRNNVSLSCSKRKNGNDMYYISIPSFYESHKYLQPGDTINLDIDSNNRTVQIDIPKKNIESTSIERIISPQEEKELEQFLVNAIQNGKLGSISIFKDPKNGQSGIYYNTKDAGIIDLLCVDENGNYIVFELKKTKTGDQVVGQLLRYMNWVKENLAQEKMRRVRGIIVLQKQDDDYENDTQVSNIRWAIRSNPDIELKFYKITITLE